MRPESPFSSKDYLASGDKWGDRIARLALPILLERAIRRKAITYSALAEEIQLRFNEPAKQRKTLYGNPIGKIGDVLDEWARQRGEVIPPLSALVIDKTTQLPGEGGFAFIRRYFVNKGQELDEKSIDPEFILKLICDSSDSNFWHLVAKDFGISLPTLAERIEDEEPIELPDEIAEFTSHREGVEHQQLKMLMAKSPRLFKKFGVFGNGVNEKVIRSGDRLDVFFENSMTCLAIEVKASDATDSEVFRGIFQCVKYKAVLQATQFSQGLIPNGQAALVLQRSLPFQAKRLVERLRIKVILIPA